MEKNDKLILFSKLTKMFDELTEWLYQGTATQTQSGMMSAEDKVKLDSISIADTNGLIPCEIGCVGNDLVVYTQSLLPADAKVTFYHYIRRRQKICPEGWNTRLSYPHKKVKGWRKVEKDNFVAPLTLHHQDDGYYGYQYVIASENPIIQQAKTLANTANTRTLLTSNYFRQRMALEIASGTGENTKPITRRLEFMMDCKYDDNEKVTEVWYSKVHQKTKGPSTAGA